MDYDFFIPEDLRGKSLRLRVREGKKPYIFIEIPQNARGLVVNPLENEDEFHGDQSASTRIQLNYYNSSDGFIGTQDIENERDVTCGVLMSKLERYLEKTD